MATQFFIRLGNGPEALITTAELVEDIMKKENYTLNQLAEATRLSKNTLLAMKNSKGYTLPRTIRSLLQAANFTPETYLHWKRTGEFFRPIASYPVNRMIASLNRKLNLEYDHGFLDDFESQYREQRKVRYMVGDAKLLDDYREERLTPASWAKDAVRSVIDHPDRALDFVDANALPTPRSNDLFTYDKPIRDAGTLADRKRKGKPVITATVSADSAGSAGAFLSLSVNADQYPFETQLNLDAANGAEQVSKLVNGETRGDAAVMGIPSSTLNMSKEYVEGYHLVAVLHYLPLVLLANDPKNVNTIFLAQGGFAQLFGEYYRNKGKGYYENSFELEPRLGQSPLAYAPDLPDGVGILAFDPAATTMCRKYGLRKVRGVPCKRGWRSFRYGVHVCLFLNKDFYDPECRSHPNEVLASQFVRAFIHEYLRCRENYDRTIDMLTEYLPFRNLYGVTAGLDN